MLQMRFGDGRAYNPSRDIVQLFPRVIAYWASVSLHPGKCPPPLKKFAKDNNLQPTDLIAAEQCLAKFVALSANAGIDDINTIYVQSGFDKLPAAANLAIMSAIGEVTLRVFFQTIRASIQAGRSVPGASELGHVAEMASFAMTSALPSVQKRRSEEAVKAAEPSIRENDPTQPM